MKSGNFISTRTAFDVDFNKRVRPSMPRIIDATAMSTSEDPGADEPRVYGTIVDQAIPRRQARSLGVGILNRLQLSSSRAAWVTSALRLMVDGPNMSESAGRVGWSCAENMMAGTVVDRKERRFDLRRRDARGGDLVCKGDVGSRTGIDQKGGTIIVGGRTGAFSGLHDAAWPHGHLLGDAGKNLGDSMYDGTIYVGGKIEEPGRRCGRQAR